MVSKDINQKIIIVLLVFFILLSIFNLGLFLNSSTESSMTGNSIKTPVTPSSGTASILIMEPPNSEVSSNEN